MMLGLGFTPTIWPGDQCLSMSTWGPVPCTSDRSSLLCWDSSSGQSGKCSDLPGGTPLPIYSLPEILSLAPSQGQQVMSATANALGCDPMVVAAGFLCSQQGSVVYYTRGQKAYTAENASQYDAPTTAQTLALNPTQVQQLTNAGLINPVSSPTQSITPTWYDPWASTPGYYLPYQDVIPASQPIAQTPTSQTVNPSTYPVYNAAPTQTQTPAVQQQQPQTQQYQLPATIPGANTAQNYQNQMAPAAVAGDGQLLPGLDNKTLYIAGGAVLLLLLLKK